MARCPDSMFIAALVITKLNELMLTKKTTKYAEVLAGLPDCLQSYAQLANNGIIINALTE